MKTTTKNILYLFVSCWLVFMGLLTRSCCIDSKDNMKGNDIPAKPGSIMDFAFPYTGLAPRVVVMTDVFQRNKDFNTDNDGIMTQVFTGNNPSIAPDFIKEFKTSYYCDIQAKDISGWNNQLTDNDFQLYTYYKGYEFHQSRFLYWINRHNAGVDFLPSAARKNNDYLGDLNNPVLPEGEVDFDLKKTFGKKVYFKDGSIIMVQDNRYNPYRWIAPFNDIMHHEATSMFVYIPSPEATVSRVEKILDNYRTLKDTTKRLILKYNARIIVDDYREEMNEYNIFDMYNPGEYENGNDLISSFHRKWANEWTGTDIAKKWAIQYRKTRLENPFIQVSTGILTYLKDNRYYLQEFMFFNKDYASTTKDLYSPVKNAIIGEYSYEGGNSGYVGWNRISIDALKVEGISTSEKMKTIIQGGEFVNLSGDNSKHIEKEVRGTIDITNYYYFARKNHFFPGEDGSYISPALNGFGVPGKPEYNPYLKPSVYSLCFMFEMAGPYRLEIQLKELDIVEL